jgi:predicted ester cyclase
VALLWGGDDARLDVLVDGAYRDHAAHDAGTGPDAFRAARRGLRGAFADVVATPCEVIGQGEHIAVRVRFRGLHVGRFAGLEPCGRTVEWEEIHLWRVREGRLVEHWAGRDDLAALRP